jgi:hypothetical protein
MTHDLLASEAAPELWKDNIWDRLLDSLDERSVIPIVGPDLLALTYGLPADDLPAVDVPARCGAAEQGEGGDGGAYGWLRQGFQG